MGAQVKSGQGFVFAEAKDNTPKKILGVLPVTAYLVNYTDGQGQQQVRLCFKPEGTDAVFVMQEKISGMHVATGAVDWFKTALNDKLAAAKVSEDGAESL